MTSVPFRLPSDIQTVWLTESLMNLTDPSPIRTLQPPEWLLDAAKRWPKSVPQPAEQSIRQAESGKRAMLGVMMMLVSERPGEPVAHRQPRLELVPGVALAATTQLS